MHGGGVERVVRGVDGGGYVGREVVGGEKGLGREEFGPLGQHFEVGERLCGVAVGEVPRDGEERGVRGERDGGVSGERGE